MFTNGKLIRCSCGKLYRWYSSIVRDQTMCPSCESSLEREYREQENIDWRVHPNKNVKCNWPKNRREFYEAFGTRC